jgi:hypothetical protein
MDTIVNFGIALSNPSWRARHNAAIESPIGVEIPIVKMIQFLNSYADNQPFGWLVGDDYVMGPALEEIVKSALTLLNGDIGRLDGGKVDQYFREYAQTNRLNID